MKPNYINHIAFVLDASGSMQHLQKDVISVFDRQVKSLAKRSTEFDQETRVSVYAFNQKTNNIIFDKDVLRLPTIADAYRASGGTALIDATIKVINDLKDTSELYGDHAFLVYVITDGEENESQSSSSDLVKMLGSLPANWTVAVMVPNAQGRTYATRCGFASGNIVTWEASTVDGLEKAAAQIDATTTGYMTMRSSGIRGTTSLFQVDTSKLASEQVNRKLDHLGDTAYTVLKNTTPKAIQIRPFVESVKGAGGYIIGNSYYALVKKEEIQPQKKICIRNKISKYVYVGDAARSMLGLPNHSTYVKPEAASKFDIFVQSTSVNRNIIPGQEVLVLN